MKNSTRSGPARLVTAGAVALALGLGALAGAAPAQAATKQVTDVTFDWGINNESNGGSYFGGCNFLSAGVAGDTGIARQWLKADGFYKGTDGNTTIVRPTADGTGVTTPTWETKCQDPQGVSVNGKTTNNADSYTKSRVQISKGTGTVDVAANTAEIQWNGSFTVSYYGGMTYWSVTNPKLVVNADGTGKLTALASGYGADMVDTSKWVKLADVPDLTIANLSNVDVTATGVSITPNFLGVSVPQDVAGKFAQAPKTTENTPWWGSFPGDFLKFQELTGQSSYWYTSAGGADSIQPRKVTSPLAVSYTIPVVQTAITTQPTQATAALNSNASFTVDAVGEALSYQWQSKTTSGEWTNIQDATSKTYSVKANAAAEAKTYRVVVTGEAGTATSQAASVVVTVPTPTIAVSKTAGINPAGETVTVTGSGFLPNEPATNGAPQRGPLAGKFAGAYVAFGKFADVWKASDGATSAARPADRANTKWAVNAADTAVIGGAQGGAIEVKPDGTFETTLTLTKNYTGVPSTGNFGIYTYPGGSSGYKPFETYTPITFTVPVADAPAKPTTALTDGNTVTVNWVAPADNGEAITGYDVTLKPATGEASTQTVAAGTTSAAFTGRVLGESYTATVVAKNAGGSSAVSPASDAIVVPATAPATPAKPLATAASATSINVSWAAPVANGSAITGYTVTVSANGSTVKTVNTSELSTTIGELSRTTDYTVTVIAKNAVGSSAASAPASVTTLSEAPGALAAPVISATGGTTANVTWAPATDDGGAAVTGYVVSVYQGANLVTTLEADASSSSQAVTNLTRGTSYTATVAAKNGAGTGAASAASAAATTHDVPSAAKAVDATSAAREVTVTWAAPASNGGSAVTGFTVTLSAGNTQVGSQNLAANATTATFENLVPGTSYTATVVATNAVGNSAAATADATVAAVAPDAPAAPVIAVDGPEAVTVTWTAPAFTGGSAITGYDVTLSDGTDEITESVDGATLSRAFDGLHGANFTATVVAKNAQGSSPSSAESVEVVVAGPQPTDEPTLGTDFTKPSENDVTVEVTGRTVTVSVGDEYAGTWVGLSVHSTPTFLGWSVANSAGVVTATLPEGLEAGTHRIVAYNENGDVIGYTTVEIAAAPAPAPGTTPTTGAPAGQAAQGGNPKALSNTGASDLSGLLIAALALMLLGAGVVTARVVTQRRNQAATVSGTGTGTGNGTGTDAGSAN